MKSGWQMKLLGEVCEFKRGLTYSKGDEVDNSKNIVLRATNINLLTGILDLSELKYISDEVVIPESKKVQSNSLLICTASGSKSHLGKVAFIDRDYGYAFGGFIGMITPSSDLVPKYLFYLMTSEAYKDFIAALADGMNIHNLKFDELNQFQVQYPNRTEQQRIVGILDEAFEGIATAKANAEKNLKNARAIFESHLQSVFTQRGDGWVEKSVKDITSILGDGLHGTPKYTDGGEYYFVNGNNLNDGEIVFKENTKRVSVTEYEKYKKRLTSRTVLVSINGTLGNVAFYNNEKIILGKSACYFNLIDSVDKQFVKYVISSPCFLQYAHKEATGATIKNVSLKSMREFRVPLPSFAEQQTIVGKLDSLREETQRLESIYQQKLAALEELKKSLLHQAFSGEL